MRKDKTKTEFESKNKVDAPEARLQTEQTTDQVMKTNTTTTPKTDFDVSEVKANGSQLKQEVAATVLAKKAGAGASGSSQVIAATRAGLKSGSYSGDAGVLLGSTANTPIMEKSSQGANRVDKRLSDANKDINYLASEQYATEFQNIAPLSEDKSTVGYNGNPMNISARAQKTSGFAPAEILYDRSIDEDRVDKIIFTNGQTVKQAGVQNKDYPTFTEKLDPQTQRYVRATFTPGKEPIRGNFAPQYLEVRIKKEKNGNCYVSKFKVHEDDLSCNDADFETVNNSSANYRIDLNQAELARQRIDANAGSPSAEFYNPLGRSTREPTATVMYLRDHEAALGATVLTAMRFGLKSRAYYLSRTGKDGQDLITPAVDALYGHLCGAKTPAELMSQISLGADGEISDRAANNYGSADIMLHIFDSIKKYKTKADLVNQPRGLKLALATGLNNHTPFRYKPEFLKALNACDYFSTIDRGYDPSSITALTDGVRLVYPYSLARSLEFTRSAANADRTYQSELFVYSFQAGKGNQTYIVKVADPLLNGVAWFLEQHATAIYRACVANDDEVTLTIPTIHYGAHFGLWDLLILASAPYIEYERTNAFKDILDYEDHHGYPFPELETISDDAVRTPKNYGRISEYERLTVEQMKPEDAIRYVLPETMIKLGTHDALLPFYFNECQFNLETVSGDNMVSMSHSCQFSTPVIRSGVRLAYLDDFFSMEPKDVMLSYDLMTCFPGDHTIGTGHKGYVYKYSLTNDGLIVAKDIHNLTILQYLSTPRQLGWFMDAPAGYCHALKSSAGLDIPGVTATEKILDQASSHVARAYFGTKNKPTTILAAAALSIDRGQAFTQSWSECCSTATEGKGANFDLAMSMNEIFTVNSHSLRFADNKSTFSPFIAGENAAPYDGLKLSGVMMAMWLRVQKLPFVINPYDNLATENLIDPLDYAYVFGLAGFLAADYNEEKYNRVNAYQDQMFGFVEDPYIIASPIFK